MSSRLLLQLPEPLFAHGFDMSKTRVNVDPYAPFLCFSTLGELLIWDVEASVEVGRRSHKKYPFGGGIYRENLPMVIAWGGRKALPLLKPGSFKQRGTIPTPQGKAHVVAATLSPCGRWLALALSDHYVLCRDLQTEAYTMVCGPYEQPVEALLFSPDSRYLVASRRDSPTWIQIWRVGHEEPLPKPPQFEYSHYDGTVGSYSTVGYPPPAFSSDSQTLYISAALGARVWHYDLQSERATLGEGSFFDALDCAFWVKPLRTGSIDEEYHDANELFIREWTLRARQSPSEVTNLRFPQSIEFAAYVESPGGGCWCVLVDDTSVYRLDARELFAKGEFLQGSRWEVLAHQVRSGYLAFDDAFDLLEKEERLLRWFAVECVLQYTLLNQPDIDRSSVFDFCSRFALESLSFKYAQQAEEFERFCREMDTRGVYETDRWRMLFFANRAKNAARRSMASVTWTDGTPVSEAWRRERLAFLCEAWGICGERTPWLLLEGKCPIEEPEEALMVR